MLDATTKKRIDAARDILVGKIPDPKSQVEQITLALIYKFMDDMDAQAEELGGQRAFFAGEFARYGWAELMNSGLGGQEKLNLYGEAISRMPENGGLPPLFRAIFRNAYLPYRDPETLNLFLNSINRFEYEDSESLGDAYEYLLAVLGVQGDAGQFRTPRHIIDFIVAAVDPQKTDAILDPACGTAGFLISAYKHILAANADAQGNDTLTPAERSRLAANLRGYDISPDFVRLSLVNMYLHGFAEPQISEYDTLTAQERWQEYADVIITNPPFMSPKGGIRPHNRFATPSKRSEVLFVDYVAEHLTAHGRAGVIVPEGIIFQNGNAYKQLRKLLVDNYLAAVISLPGGVFQPYSGVKTSILILDKSPAAQADSIAFFKVEQDGFDLGAQRRPIDRDDLPAVAAELGEYLRRRRAGESLADWSGQTGRAVSKARLAANGDYNLSGERYRESVRPAGKWPLVALGEITEVIAGHSPPGDSYNAAGKGEPFYQGKTEFGAMFIGEPVKWTTDPKRFAQGGDVLMSVRAPVGPVNLATQKIAIGRGLAAIRAKSDRLMNLYAYYVLRSMESEITGSAGASFASINKGEIEKIEIPLPPLSVQRELVAEVEGYERVIAGARQVAANWRPRVAVKADWPAVALGEVAEVIAGNAAPQGDEYFKDGVFPFVRMADVGAAHLASHFTGAKDWVNQRAVDEKKLRLFAAGTILFPKSGASTFLNHRVVLGEPAYVAGHLAGIVCAPEKALPQYVYTLLCQVDARDLTADQSYPSLRLSDIAAIQIPLPPLSVQREIVAELEKERRLAAGAGELAALLGERLRQAVGRVWG